MSSPQYKHYSAHRALISAILVLAAGDAIIVELEDEQYTIKWVGTETSSGKVKIIIEQEED